MAILACPRLRFSVLNQKKSEANLDEEVTLLKRILVKDLTKDDP